MTGSCSCSTLVIRAHYFVPLSSSFLAVTCHDRFDRDVFSSSSLFSSCFAIFHTNLETVTNWSRRPKTYQYLQHARNHLASMFPIKLFKYAIYPFMLLAFPWGRKSCRKRYLGFFLSNLLTTSSAATLKVLHHDLPSKAHQVYLRFMVILWGVRFLMANRTLLSTTSEAFSYMSFLWGC